MKYLFASDFDRTLYFQDGFHSEDLDQISSFRKSGNLFGLCTGRSSEGVLLPSQGILDYDFYLLVTGAYLLDKDKNCFSSSPLKKDVINPLLSRYGDKYSLALNTGKNYLVYTDPFSVFTERRVKEIPDKVFCLSLFAPEIEVARRIKQEIEFSFPSLKAHLNGHYLDITDNRVSKGTAIEALKKRNPDSFVFGIGDNENDIPLLKSVDYSFTFSSSPAVVKEEAKTIVSSVKEALEIAEHLISESR